MEGNMKDILLDRYISDLCCIVLYQNNIQMQQVQYQYVFYLQLLIKSSKIHIYVLSFRFMNAVCF